MMEASLISDTESGTRNFESIETDVVSSIDVGIHVEGLLKDIASELKIVLRLMFFGQNRDASVSEVVVHRSTATLSTNQWNAISLHER